MKRTAILFLCVLLGAGLAACSKKSTTQKWPPYFKDLGGFTIDSEVPGSEVFFGGQKLGTVPVTLSSNDLMRLGIPNPRVDTNLYLTSDPKGVAVSGINAQGKPERIEFMYLVPEKVRSDYVSFDTQWGTRTKPWGWSADHSFRKYVSARFRSVFGELVENSLSLKMEVIDMSATNGPWKLKAVLTNHSTQVITGFKPAIQVSQSRKIGKNGWESGTPDVVELPKEWASINPGQSLETNLQFSPDGIPGDYDLSMSFFLFKDKTCNTLSGWGYVLAPERKSFTVK
ncbi:MAG TPA: hypothetical protein VMD27_10705 [Candidatus Aquilonibacter sp.]|nr:hypothetical protein [Candidatus Aquilonibacter sp.]